MEINEIQKAIITTKEPKVLVSSAAASGKSETLVNRIKYLLATGVDPSKIVAITFTNNAASVMLERLNYPVGLFIGTVHSYCNYLLRSGAVDTSRLLDDEKFDDLFPLIEENPYCFKEVEHLLVDEAQDSTALQFKFFELIKPKNFMYFFDVRQSIYGWADADPDYLIKKGWEPDVKVFRMKKNYRNRPNILYFARKFVWKLGYGYEDDSVAMRHDSTGIVFEDEMTPSQVIEELKHVTAPGRYKDWFLLCRSNDDIALFQKLLTKAGIPNDTFKQADLSNAQIKERINADTIKVLTVHSAKGLENKNVIVYNLRAYNDEESRLCYVAATRAMDVLYWIKVPSKKKKKVVTTWE